MYNYYIRINKSIIAFVNNTKLCDFTTDDTYIGFIDESDGKLIASFHVKSWKSEFDTIGNFVVIDIEI